MVFWNILSFITPYLRRWSNVTCAYFSNENGLVQPPTRFMIADFFFFVVVVVVVVLFRDMSQATYFSPAFDGSDVQTFATHFGGRVCTTWKFFASADRFFCIEKNNSETLTRNETCYEYYDSLIILEVWGLVFLSEKNFMKFPWTSLHDLNLPDVEFHPCSHNSIDGSVEAPCGVSWALYRRFQVV